MMLTVRHFAVSAAVLLSLAGAVYVVGALAADSPLYVTGIHVNPKRPNTVYASSLGPDSVLKSTDGGKSWSVADTGLTNPASPTDSEELRVDASALDPQSPNVLYAGTGIGVLKTTDGARTWRLASTGIDFGGDGIGHRMLEGFIWAIAIDPRHTSTVYAVGNGVWKTTNGGATWKHVLRNSGVNVGIDPRQPETVYASGIKAYGKKATRNSILKTINGGHTWRATGPSALHDNYFGHPIVVDGRAPGIVYAGGSRGLFASANQGRTWRKLLSSDRGSGGVLAIALDPSRANHLYVGTASSGLMTSEDGGRTWSHASLDMPTVSAIAVDPTRSQTIYAGGGRIWKSTDGGDTWRHG